MSTKNFIVGLFENIEDTKTGVERLKANGMTSHEMLLVTHADAHHTGEIVENLSEETVGQGAMLGTATGAVLGLLGSIAVVPVIGIGSVLVSGLVWMASGSALGSYLGAIYASRFATQDEDDLKEKLAAGGVLIVLDPKKTALNEEEGVPEPYKGILESAGAVKIDLLPFDEEELAKLEEEGGGKHTHPHSENN